MPRFAYHRVPGSFAAFRLIKPAFTEEQLPSVSVTSIVELECTANMCSGITVEVYLKNCNFEKLQFFTVDLCSLYLLRLKIVILTLFSCSLFCIELNVHITSFHCFYEYNKKTVKIKKMAKIHSFVVHKLNLTTYS